ncbi:hypothetical protein ES703_100595 [subsurface metagenome]
MIICEYDFETPDHKDPNYALHEVDYYSWIPADMGIANHRLSLRKNLKTKEYEVYRRFYQKRLVSRKNVTIITGDDTGLEEIALKSPDLEKAIEFACGEYLKYHGDNMGDQVCLHQSPVIGSYCKGPKN